MPYDPSQSQRHDAIRALVGDTGDPPILAGGEARYYAISVTAATVEAGALVAARELAAQLALRPVKETAEGVTFDYSERLTGLKALVSRLEAEAAETPTRLRSGAADVGVRW